MAKTAHSEAVLTDLREDWWNADYLALLSRRFELAKVVSVADVGCGHGHWGQRLLPLLADQATLCGTDQEMRWIERARERAQALGFGARCVYSQGQAESLPFSDSQFDLVTCQTVLMHVADVARALKEMVRVAKPGGRLLLIEPNNVAPQLGSDSVHETLSPAELGRLFALLTACSRGRRAVGRGDDCVGERLPGLLTELGITDVVAYQNDSAGFVVPPHTARMKEHLEQTIANAESGFWLWNEEDAANLYRAGGGDPEQFAADYAVFVERTARFKRQVRDGTYFCGGASLCYIVSCTKSVE